MKKVFIAIAVLLVALLCVGAASAADQAYVTVNCNVNGAHIVIMGTTGTDQTVTTLQEGDVSGGEAKFNINLPAKITSIKATKDGYEDIIIPVNETLTKGDLKTYKANLTSSQGGIVGGKAGVIQVKVYAKNVKNSKETPFSNATVELYDVGDNLISKTTTSGTGIAEFKLNTTATPAKYVKVIPNSVGTEVKIIQVQTPEAGQTIPYNVEYIDTTQPASTPFPILGILAGLGGAGILLARRNNH